MNAAPPFNSMVHNAFRQFMVRNGLIDALSGEPLVNFCWCSDGPWDLRDFVVKQCFISKVYRVTTRLHIPTDFLYGQIAVPTWLARDFINVRRVVAQWHQRNDPSKPRQSVSASQ